MIHRSEVGAGLEHMDKLELPVLFQLRFGGDHKRFQELRQKQFAKRVERICTGSTQRKERERETKSSK